jgi:hypothetical protein
MSFSNIIKIGKCLDENRTLLLSRRGENYSDKDLTVHNFNNINLPITMDPLKYGKVEVSNFIKVNSSIYRYAIATRERYIVINENKTFRIDVDAFFTPSLREG